MDPEVLRRNYNYPFKTAENYEWLVATNLKKKVIGFMPVEKRKTNFVINNYYIPEKKEEVLDTLLSQAVTLFSSVPLVAVLFTEHEELFRKYGFIVEKRWKLYVKMRKCLKTNE